MEKAESMAFQMRKYVSQKDTGNFLLSKQISVDAASGSKPSGREAAAAALLPGPLDSSSYVFQQVLSDFPKQLLFIENVGDEHPESRGDYVLNEMLFV